MLTIAKLGHGRIDYYLDTVAKGIEDYYAGAGEAPGRWRGSASEALGLTGDVEADTLRAVLGGQLPGHEAPLPGGGRRRTPGWDLTFSAPKSVSVLHGLAEADIAGQVVAAHEAAVDEGLAYLERWALASRRRQDGEIAVEPGKGMIVAGFRHPTSRAGDPQLHTHALMANAVQRADGTWGAIDSRIIYRQARTAGFVYQAVLRSQLSERLGVRWAPVDRRGIAELEDVPARARTLFSKRRRQIEAALDDRGASGRNAAQIAALRTRAAKGDTASSDVLRTRWRREALEVGVSGATIARVVGALPHTALREHVSMRQRRHVNDQLLGPSGLTSQRTSYQRGEISRAWCQELDPYAVGITAATIDSLVQTTISDRRNVLLGSDDAIRGLDRRRWSARELLDVEAHVLELVEAGRGAQVGAVPPHAIDAALRRHESLSDEQGRMIEALTGNGHRVDAVVGIAGSGKTYALAVAHQLWADAGYEVIGTALSKQAANRLQADSGIRSGTLDSLLLHLDRPDALLTPKTVVVVDEAGMVPTRKLAELLGHCGAGVKVVLVGDHRQLPEIDAGGMLRSIAERYDPATLRENRRQRLAEEREALSHVRSGDINTGLDWYVRAGRVATFDDAASARQAMVDAWWKDRHTNASQLMMAERHIDVDRLNELARQRRAHAGELDLARGIAVGNRHFAVGDLVLFERNDRRMGVANGQRGIVRAVDKTRGGLTVQIDTEAIVDVEPDYLAQGHVSWGYAATVHKNQGATCDHAYLLASDRTYRELGYVALSRGRQSNRIWTVTDREPAPTDNVAHGAEREPNSDPLADLRQAMRRSAAHQLATDQLAALEPVGVDL
jgi:conjugative relaxase-like TrwC/TraI family protein